jgi:DNA-binding NarL/FixJ family response regulator
MGIRVLIADQQRTFADALAARLGTETDIEVVGALQVTTPRQYLIGREPVDVLVLDGDLPDEAANRLCQELSERGAPTRVIMLSSPSGPARIVRAIRAGAAAWVRKDESLEHLLSVIRGVARGETWLPPSETGNVMRLLLSEQDRRRENDRLLARLTPREREVLACLAAAGGQREVVAGQLHLSVNTVRTHLRNLMAKLGVHSALEAVALIWHQEDRPSPGGGSLSRPSPRPAVWSSQL